MVLERWVSMRRTCNWNVPLTMQHPHQSIHETASKAEEHWKTTRLELGDILWKVLRKELMKRLCLPLKTWLVQLHSKLWAGHWLPAVSRTSVGNGGTWRWSAYTMSWKCSQVKRGNGWLGSRNVGSFLKRFHFSVCPNFLQYAHNACHNKTVIKIGA